MTNLTPKIPSLESHERREDPYDKIVAILEACVAEAQAGPLPLGRLFDQLREVSYSLLCILLCLPFLQPVSLGPVATIVGLNFTALGWQLMRGQSVPWIPERIGKIEPSQKLWRALFKVFLFVVKICRRFTRPRLQNWISGSTGKRIGGGLMAVAGLMLALPLAGVPFSNSLPALVILFVGIGQLEHDGLMLFVAGFWLVVTLVYFALLAYTVFFLGEMALNWLWVTNWL
ncbi:MAG: exopolysaccharide biosynthesis protein [Anaerolineae bacterium]|nr:exopolysaccharide biosynthesis protein [Anaerolineae bacterium]